ncbi:hypothetical protein [Aquimarina agarivorans]|nr:hypothetical protein [Aquimarina agarivorans]
MKQTKFTLFITTVLMLFSFGQIQGQIVTRRGGHSDITEPLAIPGAT